MSPSAAVERGFRQRVLDDAVLTGYGLTAGRVLPTWPTDTLQASDYPRLTFFIVTADVVRPGTETVRLQVDEWVWNERLKLLNIDEEVQLLFDEQHWVYEGARMYSLCLPMRDYPAAPGVPMRRRRDVEIRVTQT